MEDHALNGSNSPSRNPEHEQSAEQMQQRRGWVHPFQVLQMGLQLAFRVTSSVIGNIGVRVLPGSLLRSIQGKLCFNILLFYSDILESMNALLLYHNGRISILQNVLTS